MRRRWVERGAVRAITVSYDAAGCMREVRTVVDGPEVDIQLDRTWSPSDRKRRTNGWTSQAAGVYPGLDRFGRVISQSWLDGVTGSTAAGYRPAIVDQIHTYDLASNRLSKRDGRAGASWAGRDWEYGYDSLGRLTEARQGARVIEGGRGCGRSLWCSYRQSEPPQRRALKPRVLDMLGNWTEQRTDLTGNGVFTDALDRSDARAHNLANELTQRVVSATAGGTTSANSVTLPLAYDAAGNLEEESTSASTKRRYVMKAVAAAAAPSGVTSTRGGCRSSRRNRHVGLHWRIEKHWHAVPDASDLADRKTTFWYDAAWRVVQETQRDQTNGAGTLEESIIQQVWGARYIDDAVARMRVAGNGSGGVAAGAAQELAFQLTDAQFSVIAVATPGKPGVVIDRIAYSPYGEATRTLRSDVNGDGFVDKDDYTGIIRPRNGAAIGTANYIVEADLDRNGVINRLDYDISIADDGKSSSGGVGEAGLFSRGVRNSIGYCGYIFNEDSGLYTVRFRTYSPTLGRWLERDPAGYVDGASLYQSVGGSPLSRNDPDGRLLVAIDGTASCAHRASPGFWNSGGCTTSHVLNFFIDYDLTSPALYLDGPDSPYDVWAASDECTDIEDKAYDFIVKELCKNPDEPIDLVGHSRGGYIVMQLAQRLQREGVTCPNGCKIPSPRVRFLGLYDPVDMAPDYGCGEGISGNVANSVRLLGAGDRGEGGSGATFTPNGRRLLTERSRSYFNRADGPPSACSTNHRDIWIFATHSGIGGAPWCGDRPVGHDPTNDTIQAIRSDRIIRDAARSCGVPVGKKQFCDYGFRVPAGSIPCGGGFLTPGCN